MHSRIFIIRTRKEVADGDFESLLEIEEMQLFLHLDYVIQSEEFDEDMKWLANGYEINVKSEEFQTDEGVKTFGVIAESEIPKLIGQLRIVQNDYMNELRNGINNIDPKNPDISHIRYLAGRRMGFFFNVINYDLMDDLEYLNYILNGKKEEIIITESYDYHW